MEWASSIAARTRRFVRNAANAAIPFDRRTRFRDLSRVDVRRYGPKSRIIQFYSAVDNIGNYLPVLAIQKMMGVRYDTWDIHDRNIDWDFINANYAAAIIGGAGLLHPCFELFWRNVAARLNIPYIVWGVGGCFPANSRDDLPENLIANVLKSACLVNIRDELTANRYNISNAFVCPCPTIEYVRGRETRLCDDYALFSHHNGLYTKREAMEILSRIEHHGFKCKFTSNEQRKILGLEQIIDKFYSSSRFVVTTRLHGAVIAYGLKKPYLAISRDAKITEFHRLYGNGLVVDEKLQDHAPLKEVASLSLSEPQYDRVREFAEIAREWIGSVGLSHAPKIRA